jgi:hypothetical protein
MQIVFHEILYKKILFLPPRWSPRDIWCWSGGPKYGAAEDMGPIRRGNLGWNGAGVLGLGWPCCLILNNKKMNKNLEISNKYLKQ